MIIIYVNSDEDVDNCFHYVHSTQTSGSDFSQLIKKRFPFIFSATTAKKSSRTPAQTPSRPHDTSSSSDSG
jgi:hypothetical protein